MTDFELIELKKKIKIIRQLAKEKGMTLRRTRKIINLKTKDGRKMTFVDWENLYEFIKQEV